MEENGDTPLGVYDIPDKDMWLYHDPETYGPYARLVLVGKSGEIKNSRRTLIRIHGGNQGSKFGPKRLKDLRHTKGCMRAFDENMRLLKENIDALMKNDPSEYGGELEVIDDLDGAKAVPKEKEENDDQGYLDEEKREVERELQEARSYYNLTF